MNIDHYTYRVTWSPDDNEHLGLCAEFASLSWLANTPEAALTGIRRLVSEAVIDMMANQEKIPTPLAETNDSEELHVRISHDIHRMLAIQAAKQGVSLHQFAYSKLAS